MTKIANLLGSMLHRYHNPSASPLFSIDMREDGHADITRDGNEDSYCDMMLFSREQFERWRDTTPSQNNDHTIDKNPAREMLAVEQ